MRLTLLARAIGSTILDLMPTRMDPAMHMTISFDGAREVLVAVLRDARCDDWADRVSAVSARAFGSLLGGMGSLSDLVISRENHHEIPEDREALANEMVGCMGAVCYAASIRGALDADSAVAACGTLGLVLGGWRCLACGHARVGPGGLRSLIAAVEVRRAMRDGIAAGAPAGALLALWRAGEDPESVRLLADRAMANGIARSDSDGWMRSCPACGSDDTCVYRWRDDGARFTPADDNLPLR